MRIVKEFSYLTGGDLNSSIKNEKDAQIEEFNKSSLKHCIMIDEDNCKYEFIYTFQMPTERIYIEILNDKLCPNVQNVLYFMGFIVFLIILIGLLALIIWKVIVDYKDKKDYEEWIEYLKGRKFTSTGVNPLFLSPNTEIKNPLYQSKVES